MIRDCQISDERLAPLRECLVDSTGDNEPGEWPGNYISTQTVAYSCGILARSGEAVVHDHDQVDWLCVADCRRRQQNSSGRAWLGMWTRAIINLSPLLHHGQCRR